MNNADFGTGGWFINDFHRKNSMAAQPEDYVMMENIDSYDEVQKDGSLEHNVMGIQVFVTDRAYVDKDELKKLKKENKMKMTYQNIRQFERSHNIPTLPSRLQQKLNELWKAGD